MIPHCVMPKTLTSQLNMIEITKALKIELNMIENVKQYHENNAQVIDVTK